MNFNALGSLWSNPFTTSMGVATAAVTILHALGVNLPVDPAVLSGIFTTLGLFAAKDGNVTGGAKKQ